MAILTPGKTLRSRSPELLVENALAPGRWRFELVVVDDERNESEPVELIVEVEASAPVRPRGPVTDLRPIRPVIPVERPR